MRSLALRLAIAVAGLVLLSASGAAAATDIKMDLAGPALQGKVPVGTAQYHGDTDYKTFKLTVTRVYVPKNTVLTVRIGTAAVGTVKILIPGGSALLSLDTRKGNTIPTMTGTTAVTVKKADNTLVMSGPQTGPKYLLLRASLTGAAIGGVTPSGSASYNETDYGYTRTLRIFATGVNLAGTRLDLYVGTTLLPAYYCTVTSSKMCLLTASLKDSDPVSRLTSSSVVKLKNHAGGAVILTTGTWH